MNQFSIIIPTYNSMKYIKECIANVLLQNNINFDIIILGSGNTNDTLEYVESQKSEKIKIYKIDKRLMIEENLNKIKTIPKKQYMTILGHLHDLIYDFLETINQLIIENPTIEKILLKLII